MNSSTDPESSELPRVAIPVGYVRRAHGINGAVIVKPLSDDPNRFAAGVRLTTDSEAAPKFVIESSRPHKDGLLVSFAGVTDRNQAEQLRGVSLLITASQRRELPGDEFWIDQLVGMRVLDVAGTDVGTVTAVATGSAQDRLQIDTASGRYEVPFVADLVPKVDLDAGLIVIDPPDGLFDD